MRKVLEASGEVRAMVEGPAPASSSYAEGAIWPSGAFTVTGWRNAQTVRQTGQAPGPDTV